VSNNEFDCPLNEPWLSFLAMLDQKLSGPTTLICMGGFAMTHRYGSPRQTHDLDASHGSHPNASLEPQI